MSLAQEVYAEQRRQRQRVQDAAKRAEPLSSRLLKEMREKQEQRLLRAVDRKQQQARLVQLQVGVEQLQAMLRDKDSRIRSSVDEAMRQRDAILRRQTPVASDALSKSGGLRRSVTAASTADEAATWRFGVAVARHHEACGDAELLPQVLRFHQRAAPLVLRPPTERQARLLERTSTRRFLQDRGYSEHFAQHYLLPISADLWDVSEVSDLPKQGLGDLPITTVVRLWQTRLLLDCVAKSRSKL